jgi:hypothetical protein
MKMLPKLLLTAGILVALPGCDQFREQVAGWIAPASPSETLKSVDTLIEQGRLKEAKNTVDANIDETEAWKHHFELAAARIHAMQGDQDTALQYLSKALPSLEITADELMKDEALASLHSDVRFLQIITGQVSQPNSQPTASSGGMEVKAGEETKIKITNQGTEVRAGDVVIKLPN